MTRGHGCWQRPSRCFKVQTGFSPPGSGDFQLDPSVFEKTDVHIHVPAGAIPKDGPSAGVAMFIALAALAADIRRVMLPARNRKDLDEVHQQARQHLEFIFLDTVEEAAQAAIEGDSDAR